jgi:hypothetical protein
MSFNAKTFQDMKKCAGQKNDIWLTGKYINKGVYAVVYELTKVNDSQLYAMRIYNSDISDAFNNTKTNVFRLVPSVNKNLNKLEFQNKCAEWGLCVPIIDNWKCGDNIFVEIYPRLKHTLKQIFSDKGKNYGYMCCIFMISLRKLLKLHTEYNYIHGDCHLENIMTDNDDNVFLIDIDKAEPLSKEDRVVDQIISDYRKLFSRRYKLNEDNHYVYDLYFSQFIINRLETLKKRTKKEKLSIEYIKKEEEKYIKEFIDSGVVYPWENIECKVKRTAGYMFQNFSVRYNLMNIPEINKRIHPTQISKRYYYESEFVWPGNNIYKERFIESNKLSKIKQDFSFSKIYKTPEIDIYVGPQIYNDPNDYFIAIFPEPFKKRETDEYFDFTTMKDFIDNAEYPDDITDFWKKFYEELLKYSEKHIGKVIYITSYGIPNVNYFYLRLGTEKPLLPK